MLAKKCSIPWQLISVSIVVLAVLALSACRTPGPTSAPPTQVPTSAPPTPIPPAAVVLAGVEPLNAGDVEGALAYWADDATVRLVGVPPDVPDTYTGKEQVRAWFKDLVAAHFEIQVEVLKVEGDTVTTNTQTWQDTTRALGVAPLVATEVYVIEGGTIASLTWTISDESLARLQAAMAPAVEPTATYTPETQASKTEDVVGVWLVKYLLDNAGSAHLEFTEEGTYSVVGVSGDANGATIDTGKFWFEDAQLVLDNGGCFNVRGELIKCVAIYQVYVTRQGDKPVQLRLAVVDDPATDRRRTFDGKTLPLAQP